MNVCMVFLHAWKCEEVPAGLAQGMPWRNEAIPAFCSFIVYGRLNGSCAMCVPAASASWLLLHTSCVAIAEAHNQSCRN